MTCNESEWPSSSRQGAKGSGQGREDIPSKSMNIRTRWTGPDLPLKGRNAGGKGPRSSVACGLGLGWGFNSSVGLEVDPRLVVLQRVHACAQLFKSTPRRHGATLITPLLEPTGRARKMPTTPLRDSVDWLRYWRLHRRRRHHEARTE